MKDLRENFLQEQQNNLQKHKFYGDQFSHEDFQSLHNFISNYQFEEAKNKIIRVLSLKDENEITFSHIGKFYTTMYVDASKCYPLWKFCESLPSTLKMIHGRAAKELLLSFTQNSSDVTKLINFIKIFSNMGITFSPGDLRIMTFNLMQKYDLEVAHNFYLNLKYLNNNSNGFYQFDLTKVVASLSNKMSRNMDDPQKFHDILVDEHDNLQKFLKDSNQSHLPHDNFSKSETDFLHNLHIYIRKLSTKFIFHARDPILALEILDVLDFWTCKLFNVPIAICDNPIIQSILSTIDRILISASDTKEYPALKSKAQLLMVQLFPRFNLANMQDFGVVLSIYMKFDNKNTLICSIMDDIFKMKDIQWSNRFRHKIFNILISIGETKIASRFKFRFMDPNSSMWDE